MSASANVCGNCANFKPRQGEKFFNCTYAKQGGVKYAMQVRADTRSCEAFSPLNQPAKPPTKAQPTPPPPKRAEPQPGGLCPWGRIILIAAIIIIILLLAWGAYTCASGRAKPAPTPTPTPTAPPPTSGPPPTVVITPPPSPTPIPVYQYNLGQWVTAPPLLILASNAVQATTINAPGPIVAPTGTSFIIVTVTVTNGAGYNIPIAATDFTIVSQSGFSFPATQEPFLFYQGFQYQQFTIAPGQTYSGRLVYTVPDVVAQLRLQLSTANGIVQWILPW